MQTRQAIVREGSDGERGLRIGKGWGWREKRKWTEMRVKKETRKERSAKMPGERPEEAGCEGV